MQSHQIGALKQKTRGLMAEYGHAKSPKLELLHSPKANVAWSRSVGHVNAPYDAEA